MILNVIFALTALSFIGLYIRESVKRSEMETLSEYHYRNYRAAIGELDIFKEESVRRTSELEKRTDDLLEQLSQRDEELKALTYHLEQVKYSRKKTELFEQVRKLLDCSDDCILFKIEHLMRVEDNFNKHKLVKDFVLRAAQCRQLLEELTGDDATGK